MFFNECLCDDDIKKYIADTSISILASVFIYFFVGLILFATLLFVPNENLREALSWVAGVAMIFVLYKVVSFQTDRAERIKESLIDEHLKASLMNGTYIKLAPNFFEKKRQFTYYIKVRTENGKVCKCPISEQDDKQIFHTYTKGQPVVILKYPRYKRPGYKYEAFDAATFRNQSSLSFDSCGEVDW